MKNIRIIVILLTVIFMGSACENQLDVVPQGTPTEGSFWKNQNDAISAINGVYYDLTSEAASEAMYGRGYMWQITTSDDMVIGRSRARVENMNNFTCTGDEGELLRLWVYPYLVIKRANDVLRNVPNIDMDEDLKNRILGEAYFISGVMYFQLSYIYGDDRAGIPILDEEDPLNYELPRVESVSINYEHCADLFKKAAEKLPYFDELSTDDYGRAHKTAAWAYLAKTYLYAGKWEEAEQAADLVINSNKHDLLDSYEDVFKVENNWSQEYIWSVTSNTEFGSMLPGVMLENKGWGYYNGWGYFHPTKELYDAFEEGDERREVTLLKEGDVFTFFGEEFTYSSTNSQTGYQFNKYMEPFKNGMEHLNPNGDFPTTDLNVPLMRYAEVLLIRAEAKLMQGGNADTELNLIRHRAGLESKTNMTMADLKNERRCELAGEFADRHRDLVRWGDADSVYALPLHKANGEEVWPGRPQFDPTVHHVWPIPPSEIDKSNGMLVQNQGW